jgi:hypothetical protein
VSTRQRSTRHRIQETDTLAATKDQPCKYAAWRRLVTTGGSQSRSHTCLRRELPRFVTIANVINRRISDVAANLINLSDGILRISEKGNVEEDDHDNDDGIPPNNSRKLEYEGQSSDRRSTLSF